MVDPYTFAMAQKITWVKLLFDNKIDTVWKTIEMSALETYGDMLWTSYAPECILNKLRSSQLADSIRTWYVFRDKAVNEIYGCDFSDYYYYYFTHLGNCLILLLSTCTWFSGLSPFLCKSQ